jgi:hypothetical protein
MDEWKVDLDTESSKWKLIVERENSGRFNKANIFFYKNKNMIYFIEIEYYLH